MNKSCGLEISSSVEGSEPKIFALGTTSAGVRHGDQG